MNNKKAGWLMLSVIVFHIVAVAVNRGEGKEGENRAVNAGLLPGIYCLFKEKRH